MKSLNQKIKESIALIQRGERLALLMQPAVGYHVAFSGGKDSQVVLELVKMAGVKYRAVYNVTTVDAPESVYFIRNNYPEVKFSFPKDNFFRLIEKNGMPTQLRRYCCRILKETQEVGCTVIDGIRHQESKKRSAYKEVSRLHKGGHINNTLSNMENAQFQCVGGKDKVSLHPILNWSENDVWNFIKKRGLVINPCYADVERVGCMFCPFSRRKQLQFYREQYPRYYERLLRHIQRYIDTHDCSFSSAEDLYKWWESKKSIKAYQESLLSDTE